MKVKGATTQLRRFNNFCHVNKVLPLTDDIIDQAADIYAGLHKQGKPIGDADVLIAATALIHGVTVVTNNERHFTRVPGLQIQNLLK
jgi:tRNA(fMet)-specific endonuclease VapC